MGQILSLHLLRKACRGFFRCPEKSNDFGRVWTRELGYQSTNTGTWRRYQRRQDESRRESVSLPFSRSSSLLCGIFLATYSNPNPMTLLHVSDRSEEEMTQFTFFVAVEVTLWRHGCGSRTEIWQRSNCFRLSFFRVVTRRRLTFATDVAGIISFHSPRFGQSVIVYCRHNCLSVCADSKDAIVFLLQYNTSCTRLFLKTEAECLTETLLMNVQIYTVLLTENSK